ncbi:MAG TPA: hypothetical protein VIY47_07305 [Ignavibacteriaceae bacterium]
MKQKDTLCFTPDTIETKKIFHFPEMESKSFPDPQHLPHIFNESGNLIRPEIILSITPNWLHDSSVFKIFWAGMTLCYYSEHIGNDHNWGMDFPEGLCTKYNFNNSMAILEDMQCFMHTANSLRSDQYREHSNLGTARKILNWWWKECHEENASHIFKEFQEWKKIYERRMQGMKNPAIICHIKTKI